MSRPLFLTALLLAPVPAHAQGNPPARPQAEEGAEEEIVVTGQRARGAALGEIKPEVTLGSGDIRSLGVGSVTEILAELAPQIRGTSGGQPLILLEGHRISGRQEIERIPAEAIARVDVLPEQVAIKYGYPATQKVVNFVLRKRFRAWTLEGRSRFATGGGAFRGQRLGQLFFGSQWRAPHPRRGIYRHRNVDRSAAGLSRAQGARSLRRSRNSFSMRICAAAGGSAFRRHQWLIDDGSQARAAWCRKAANGERRERASRDDRQSRWPALARHMGRRVSIMTRHGRSRPCPGRVPPLTGRAATQMCSQPI
jgi:outer membrane receptor protein involved in Fe transport